MSDNKVFVRRFFETMDSGNWDELRALMHPDHIFNFPLAPGPLDREAHVGLCVMFRGAFSDIRHGIDDQIEDDDKVVTRGTVHVRHTGEFNGIAPTGASFEFGYINIMRIKDGMNFQEWDEVDGLKLMREIGAIPA